MNSLFSLKADAILENMLFLAGLTQALGDDI